MPHYTAASIGDLLDDRPSCPYTKTHSVWDRRIDDSGAHVRYKLLPSRYPFREVLMNYVQGIKSALARVVPPAEPWPSGRSPLDKGQF